MPGLKTGEKLRLAIGEEDLGWVGDKARCRGEFNGNNDGDRTRRLHPDNILPVEYEKRDAAARASQSLLH